MHARSPQMHFARPSPSNKAKLVMLLRARKKIGASSSATWQPASLPFPSLPKPLSLVGSPRGCLSWRYYRYGTTMQRCPLQAFPGVFGRSAGVLHPPPYLFALFLVYHLYPDKFRALGAGKALAVLDILLTTSLYLQVTTRISFARYSQSGSLI